MQEIGKDMGMDINPPQHRDIPPSRKNRNGLMEFFKSVKEEVQLVVVVIPGGNWYGKGLTA
jgi:hypothetical protein